MISFERLPDEPVKAFSAFTIFRDMPNRSIERAYHSFLSAQGKPPKPPPGQWTDWSTKWQWRERAAEYVAAQDKQILEMRQQRRKEQEQVRLDREMQLPDQFWEHSKKMLRLIDKMMQAPVTDVVQDREETVDGKVIRTQHKVKGLNPRLLEVTFQQHRESVRLATVPSDLSRRDDDPSHYPVEELLLEEPTPDQGARPTSRKNLFIFHPVDKAA
jgi:hypothetical protein